MHRGGAVVRVWDLWAVPNLLVAIPVPRKKKCAYVLLLQGVATAIVIVLCLIEEVASEAFALKSR